MKHNLYHIVFGVDKWNIRSHNHHEYFEVAIEPEGGAANDEDQLWSLLLCVGQSDADIPIDVILSAHNDEVDQKVLDEDHHELDWKKGGRCVAFGIHVSFKLQFNSN